ncbi:MAG: hypothetical protein N2203_08630, partial [Bacteroidia bacterium]|nr:hypothetical protein [Bacteroidia bacterium]
MSFFLQYKDLLRLLSGHVIAQIIALLFSPILTRIYNPTDYALLGIMLASSNVLFEFYTLKYDRTIVISSKKIISINLLFLCLIISFLMTLITLVINYYLIDYNALYKLHPQISILKYILPIITFFMAIVTSYYFWFQRISKYDSIAVNKIFQITIISLLSLLLGIFNIQNGLVVGYFIGWLFTFIFGIIQ